MSKVTDYIANKNKGEPFDIYIGRGSLFGNPWSHMKSSKAEFYVETREDACNCYRDWLLGICFCDIAQRQRTEILHSLPSLKGKVLGCYCKGVGRCHGETLVRLANLF